MNKTLCPIWLAFLLFLPTTLPGSTAFNLPVCDSEIIDGHYYRLLFFRELPNTNDLVELQRSSIKLLEYIQPNTYLAAIPESVVLSFFDKFPIKNIQPINADWRLSDELKNGDFPDWAISKNNLKAILKFHKNIPFGVVLGFCETAGIEVLASNRLNNFLRVSFPKNKLGEIAGLHFIAHLSLAPPPSTPDDEHGKAMHRSNVLNSQYPNGRHYDGFGVGVLCRDDGMVGPHIDFNGRLDNSYVVNPNNPGGKHGDGVCGIVGGAGNLNPRRQGMAPAASIYTIDYEADFLDETMAMHLEHNVLVTNSSYSNGCNAGYTVIAETVDQQLFDYPTFMHVFSAGNSNNLDCGYGAGNQWGNITGGHKQAKNCITVANLEADGTLANTSSRGPAKDGRIKPDIAAFGDGHISTDHENTYQVFGGTSAAAPGVAGVLAQLHQAFRSLNNGVTADAALLKACLLNSANDLGLPGPDFKYGWGQVNALRAVETLEQNRFLKSSISPGQYKSHSIMVPAGVIEARAMLYWHDREASIVSDKALVNNLDLKMTGPNGQIFLPWLPDPTANPINLGTPAGKGIDNLNNMEQVAIDNPQPGNYSLEVFGKEMPFGQLPYYIVWEFRTAAVTLTYPIGGEAFAPGDTVSIQWDAVGGNGFFQISYSINAGANFTDIATVEGQQRMFAWVVPNAISGMAKVRVKHNGTGETGISNAHFSIAPQPKNVRATKACPDFIEVKWDAVDFGSASSATTYQVFLLATKNMEIIGTTTSTEFNVPTIGNDPTKDHWIAVKALGNNGLHSERTIAIRYNSGLLACQQEHDLSIVKIDSPGEGTIFGCGNESLPVKATFKNTGSQTESNIQLAYQINGGLPTIETFPGSILPGQSKTYVFTKKIDLSGAAGISLNVYSILQNDVATFNDHASVDLNLAIYDGSGETPDYGENFDGPAFPPPYFAIENPDAGVTWLDREVTGSDGQMTHCMFMNNYAYANTGQEDAFLVIPIDLTGSDNPVLKFDVAYAQYSSTYSDGMRVEISMDCGQTFAQTIFEKHGEELATAENHNQLFLPSSASEWRTESINLSDFIGHSIVLKFINITGYGNSLFIDNIKVLESALPTAHFSASAVEICKGGSVVFTNQSSGQGAVYDWQFGQTASPPGSDAAGEVEVVFPTAGAFTVLLNVSNSAGSSSFSQIIKVKEPPIPGFGFAVTNSQVAFNNTSLFADGYDWDFGDGSSSPAASPVHNYQAMGIFYVVLSATNVCGTYTSEEQEVAILVNALQNKEEITKVAISPNPASDMATLLVSTDQPKAFNVSVKDLRGGNLFTKTVVPTSTQSEIELPVGHFPKGVYFIEVLSAQERKVLKLVVAD